MIYVIIGKSAAGKDTIYKEILSKCNITPVVYYTTRPQRVGEVNGVDYYFVNNETIEKAEKAGTLIEKREYSTVNGLWTYATINDGWGNNINQDFIIVLPPQGYVSFCKFFGEENVTPIYIFVPDGIRLRRSIERDEQQSVPNFKETCRRFLSDEEDFKDMVFPPNNVFRNDDAVICAENIIRAMNLK